MHTSSGPCALHTVCTGTPSYARALAVCTNLAGVDAPLWMCTRAFATCTSRPPGRSCRASAARAHRTPCARAPRRVHARLRSARTSRVCTRPGAPRIPTNGTLVE